MKNELNSIDSQRILEEALARNAPVELHFPDGSGPASVARSRVLSLDADQICVDQPGSDAGSRPLTEGRALEAFIRVGEIQYSFSSRVLTAHCRVRLNDRMDVPGMAIARPRCLTSRQRRDYFRVSLARLDSVSVEFHTATRDDSGTCPIDARRFRGKLQNISEGGFGVLLAPTAGPLEVGACYFVGFELPGCDDAFLFLAELRFLRPIRDGSSVLAGLRLCMWDPAQTRRRIEQLRRFVIDVQRRSIMAAR
ncbi:MAG: PilZ domain-containing protein [Phycisphaerae bacterium]